MTLACSQNIIEMTEFETAKQPPATP